MKLLQSITNPSNDSKLWAVWIWNGRVFEEQILSQIQGFIDKGFGGIIIKPSRDLSPACFSKEFYDIFEKVLKKASDADLSVRIAEDFSVSWSGLYDHILDKDPECRSLRLTLLEHIDITHKEPVEYRLDEPDKYLILAAKVSDSVIDMSNVIPLEEHIKEGVLSWKPSDKNTWRVIILQKVYEYDCNGNYLPNPFRSKFVQKYISSVLEKFRAGFNKYLSGVFKGFVNEMPPALPDSNSIAWDDDLITKYKSRYKKDMLTLLPALFFEVDDANVRIRSHILSFIYFTMFEKFPGVFESWAKRHRFSQWVLSGEQRTDPENEFFKDIVYQTDAKVNTTGIQCHNGINGSYSVFRASVDSNSIEIRRESLAVVGRNRNNQSSTLASLKNEIETAVISGAKHIIMDGCFVNLERRGYLKTPFNPFWYHEAWDNIDKLTSYTASVNEMLKDAQWFRSVAVVSPYQSGMADYYRHNNEKIKEVLKTFTDVLHKLDENGFPYDIVTEKYLVSCSINNNGEVSPPNKERKGNYQAIIIPYSRIIDNSLFVLLEKILGKGGTIIFINEPPQGTFNDGKTNTFAARVAKMMKPKYENANFASVNTFCDYMSKVTKTTEFVPNTFVKNIKREYAEFKDYSIYCIMNTSDVETRDVNMVLPLNNHFYYIDVQEQKIHDLEPSEVQEEGYALFDMTTAPGQVHYIASSSNQLSSSDEAQLPDFIYSNMRNYRIIVKGKWSFKPDDYNMLPVSNINMKFGINKETAAFSHYHEGYFEADRLPEKAYLAFCGILNKKFRNNECSLFINGCDVGKIVEEDPD
ncbi:MAG: hypothetical protein ACOCSE_01865, partial [Chitinivibrionales bacterium]